MWAKEGTLYLYPPDGNLTMHERFVIQEAELDRLGKEWEESQEHQSLLAEMSRRQDEFVDWLQQICRRLGSGKIFEHWRMLTDTTLPFCLTETDAMASRYCTLYYPSPQFAELQYMLQADTKSRRTFRQFIWEQGSDYYRGEWWNISRYEHLRRMPFCIECFPQVIWGTEIVQLGNKKLMQLLEKDGGHLIDYQRWLPLHVHHTSYNDRDGARIFGLEAIHMDLLVTLCSKHHGENHGTDFDATAN